MAPSSGIPKKFLVGLKRTWNQKLSHGLMFLTFMNALSDSGFMYKPQFRRFWQFPHDLDFHISANSVVRQWIQERTSVPEVSDEHHLSVKQCRWM